MEGRLDRSWQPSRAGRRSAAKTQGRLWAECDELRHGDGPPDTQSVAGGRGRNVPSRRGRARLGTILQTAEGGICRIRRSRMSTTRPRAESADSAEPNVHTRLRADCAARLVRIPVDSAPDHTYPAPQACPMREPDGLNPVVPRGSSWVRAWRDIPRSTPGARGGLFVSGPTSTADQAARDDAHLESLGIKPELKRSLGFLSNFAVAFSLHQRLDRNLHPDRPWPGRRRPVVLLVLAAGRPGPALRGPQLRRAVEPLPSRGSIYQWSKRLSNRTLGFFTGWIYFWAGVLTVTAVAATVPLVLLEHLRLQPQRAVTPAGRQ